MIVHSPAVVLKSFSYSETSIIAKCFTRELGKVSVIVRGAKRKNSPNAAYFQPANYLDLVFYHKPTREIQTLSKASFVKTWPCLGDDLKKTAYALSAIELTDKTTTGYDAHIALFDELINVISRFDKENKKFNLIFWCFELKLLSLLGFKPDFKNKNQSKGISDPFAGPNSEKLLKELQGGIMSETLINISVTKKDRKVIGNYLNSYFRYHFDGINKLKSFEVLRQVLA